MTEDALIAAFRKTDFDLAMWPDSDLRDLARQVKAHLDKVDRRSKLPYDAMGDYSAE
jgi:hypothetical protein